MGKTFNKDPDATLDYTFDWSNWLQTGETISTINITAGTGITVDSSANDGSAVTVWLSGGTAGKAYEVNCEITTDSSPARTDQRTIIINVDDK